MSIRAECYCHELYLMIYASPFSWVLQLHSANYTGVLQSEIGLLSNLEVLSLHTNQHLQGTVPDEWAKLSMLTTLELHNTRLTGSIPRDLCALFENGTVKVLSVDCKRVVCSCRCVCFNSTDNALPSADTTAPSVTIEEVPMDTNNTAVTQNPTGGGDGQPPTEWPEMIEDPVPVSATPEPMEWTDGPTPDIIGDGGQSPTEWPEPEMTPGPSEETINSPFAENLGEVTPEPNPDAADAAADDATESLTRQECVDQGGSVVGDIGNGAIYQEDYRCESNGAPPLGNIVPTEGGPVAVEGEVCCGPSLSDSDPVGLAINGTDTGNAVESRNIFDHSSYTIRYIF